VYGFDVIPSISLYRIGINTISELGLLFTISVISKGTPGDFAVNKTSKVPLVWYCTLSLDKLVG